jgi:hypothetical protein
MRVGTNCSRAMEHRLPLKMSSGRFASVISDLVSRIIRRYIFRQLRMKFNCPWPHHLQPRTACELSGSQLEVELHRQLPNAAPIVAEDYAKVAGAIVEIPIHRIKTIELGMVEDVKKFRTEF